MKANIITAALALCLTGAPVAANAFAGIDEVSMPAKKTTKKTTKKSAKTSGSKSAKTSSKSKTSKTSQASAPLTPSSTKTDAQTGATKTDGQTGATKQSGSNAATQSQQSSGSSVLGGILGSVLGSASGSSTDNGNGVLSALSTIFDASKGASKNNIVGTWTYTEPAVVFKSNNALKNIGGKVASETIEKQLQAQFEKLGIKKGTMTMTFDKDGNFSQTVAGKTTSGTYSVSKGKVTLKYGGTVQQIVGTTQVDGNDLLIVMDASKLLKYANTIGSLTGNSLLKGAGSLLSSMDGMEIGLKLNK